MTLLEIIFLSVALSMDAVAVSITNGMSGDKTNLKVCFITSFSFAFFQAIMPIIGYLSTFSLTRYITAFNHYIAFFVLCFIGFKMIFSSLKKPKDIYVCYRLTYKTILAQSIATSLDALAVGMGFVALSVPLLKASLIIFFVTFALTFLAAFVGKKVSKFFKFKSEILGGILLIVIGLKILLDPIV